MSIITISRGSYSRGKEVAEKVAEKLGYECISRDILLEASERYNTPEIKLVRALHDPWTFFQRFSGEKAKYVAYIRAALLSRMRKDNVVYHGLAGHYFLPGVSHVLKVRIIADLEDRIQEEMKRENISADEARRILENDDEQRRKWSEQFYGTDPWDPRLYDMTMHIHTLRVSDSVDILAHTVQLPHFRTTPESRQILEDLYLSAVAEAALVGQHPYVSVAAHNGEVIVVAEGPLEATEIISQEIKKHISALDGVKSVRVDVQPIGHED